MVSPYPYIAIEGAIGAGKTTLSRVLSETLPAELLTEVFEENPFLSDFYADRARYAFQTQLFFLLSRYRQQHSVIASTVARAPLVSDYFFAKDWLFAHLNLSGDELEMYERVHAILGGQIPSPDLVVYLRATTDTLMSRIANRDRPYERHMSREYIAALRAAYESHFASPGQGSLLVVETDHLDIVHDPDARGMVVAQIREALSNRAYQPAFPELTELVGQPATHRLRHIIAQHDSGAGEPALGVDPLLVFLQLGEEFGKLSALFQLCASEQERLLPQIGNRQEARSHTLAVCQGEFSVRISALLARLLQLADAAGVDLTPNAVPRVGPENTGHE
jgi:deoxyguanosine kinase